MAASLLLVRRLAGAGGGAVRLTTTTTSSHHLITGVMTRGLLVRPSSSFGTRMVGASSSSSSSLSSRWLSSSSSVAAAASPSSTHHQVGSRMEAKTLTFQETHEAYSVFPSGLTQRLIDDATEEYPVYFNENDATKGANEFLKNFQEHEGKLLNLGMKPRSDMDVDAISKWFEQDTDDSIPKQIKEIMSNPAKRNVIRGKARADTGKETMSDDELLQFLEQDMRQAAEKHKAELREGFQELKEGLDNVGGRGSYGLNLHAKQTSLYLSEIIATLMQKRKIEPLPQNLRVRARFQVYEVAPVPPTVPREAKEIMARFRQAMVSKMSAPAQEAITNLEREEAQSGRRDPINRLSLASKFDDEIEDASQGIEDGFTADELSKLVAYGMRPYPGEREPMLRVVTVCHVLATAAGMDPSVFAPVMEDVEAYLLSVPGVPPELKFVVE